MPGLDSVEATLHLKAEFSWINVIGLSMHEESDMAQAICNAGAVAYLNKSGPSEKLIEAIRSCGNQASE